MRTWLQFLLTLLLTTTCPLLAMAGYAPYTQSQSVHYGQGVWYAPLQFTVYEKPSMDSKPLARITWGPTSEQTVLDILHQKTIAAHQCMVAYYPAYQLALMTVLGDAEPDWAEVVWDQATGKTGWVKVTGAAKPGFLPEPGAYQTWTEFMITHAKPAGIRWFNGVPDGIRELRSSPDDMAKVIPAFYLQKLKVLHLKGNWMLMQGLDMERHSPIGWVRWREDNGQLLLFPNLDTPENPWRQAFYSHPNK